MVTRTTSADSNQGDGGLSCAHPCPAHQLHSRAGNTVFKSGPLFISSRGIGWTSWKRRWFILTRTSLVFFRSDPSIIPQKGSEVNLTLGGIELNNSGSVVVRANKKLLTVLFPEGRDGRAFTLKAETLENLYDWKVALENALAQAPSAVLVMGQNGIFHNDPADTVDEAFEQWREKRPVKSLVVGRPILLALEGIDGAPSFLEKALKFIEQYGIKVEGILRQAADVDDVERRVQEYEQGKNEFTTEEDAHVVADCVKHVLRELPSSPVPASCCNALLEACRADPRVRVNAMRAAISETFPEPNRRLLQRILKMMRTVASRKSENRMSSSAVAACMAPLLLRSLLAGDCDLENDFNKGGDGSLQLLQAAAAANYAQTIVTTLIEEYNNIFGDDHPQGGSISAELFSESEESGSEEVESTDDDEVLEDDGYHDAHDDLDADTEDDALSALSESSGNEDDDLYLKARKKLSKVSIDCVSEDEVAIQRLEVTKIDLQNKISKEAKGNAILQATLERRKQAFYERRLALEQDVAGLQEQLQKERDLRANLEAGLNMPLGHIPISLTIDKKTKIELKEVALVEADVINLKQKVVDFHVQLNQQGKKNYGYVCESCSQHQQSPNHQATLMDQQKVIEAAATADLHERPTRSEEPQSLPKKQSPQKEQLNSTSNDSTKSVRVIATSSTVETVILAPTNSKKYGAKVEGTISTSSALSKLTIQTQLLKGTANPDYT